MWNVRGSRKANAGIAIALRFGAGISEGVTD